MNREQKKENKSEVQADHAVLFQPPKLKHADIKKRVLERLKKGEYEKLKQDLRSYKLTTERICKFFLKEGSLLLKWSLINMATSESLRLWIELVPKDVLLTILCENDFSIFRSFLRTQVGLEREDWYTEKEKIDQIEKFKALLSIDAEIFAGFMKEKAKDKNITSEEISENFKQAFEQFTAPASSMAASN